MEKLRGWCHRHSSKRYITLWLELRIIKRPLKARGNCEIFRTCKFPLWQDGHTDYPGVTQCTQRGASRFTRKESRQLSPMRLLGLGSEIQTSRARFFINRNLDRNQSLISLWTSYAGHLSFMNFKSDYFCTQLGFVMIVVVAIFSAFLNYSRNLTDSWLSKLAR